MNLHALVAPIIARINPFVNITIYESNGSVEDTDGTKIPSYLPGKVLQAQVQALSYTDIIQTQGLNIQGKRYAVYLNGDWEGIVRPRGKGGDMLVMPDGKVWLVAMVLEDWSVLDGWTKLCVTLQNDKTIPYVPAT